MPEVIVLDDDDGDIVSKASMRVLQRQPSPPPAQQLRQSGLAEQQRQRMAQQKELALARRLAKENFASTRLVGGQQSVVSAQLETEPRILHSSNFQTPVVDHRDGPGLCTGRALGSGEGGKDGHGYCSSPRFSELIEVQGEVAAGSCRDFKRKQDESTYIDIASTTGDQGGWRVVRKRPMPGQSFGRDMSCEHFNPMECVDLGEKTTSFNQHELPDEDWKRREDVQRAAAGPSLPPVPSEHSDQDAQNPGPETNVKPKLSQQQMQVLKAILKGNSVFLTGSAGTGKSFVLEYAIRLLNSIHSGEGVYVTASTGLAASALGGTTLHSFAGVGLGTGKKEDLVDKAKSRRDVRHRWMFAKALIIDEISMIDGEFFDKLDHIGRIVRNKPQPFGGIQLVVTGDFYQLPPVNPQNLKKYFAFDADCWHKCFNLQIELKAVFRQTDQQFVDTLNEIRRGQCSPSVRRRLENCSGPVGDNSGVILTRLYPRKMDVGRENDQNLRALGQPTFVFRATDEARNDFVRKQLDNVRVEPVISLSCGAQVMLAKNLEVSAGLVNGARGVVVGFSNPRDRASMVVESARSVSASGSWPLVRFACDDQVRMIKPETWSILEGNKEMARRTQIPLLLAWALSVHKCQGMTLDRVETDLTRAFDYGMVYVALSRVKSLDGLRLIGFDPSRIKVHHKVTLFYEKLKQANDTDEGLSTE